MSNFAPQRYDIFYMFEKLFVTLRPKYKTMDIRYQFSKHLFWDTKIEDIDMEKHAPYVVQRVLEYGLMEDWKLLRSYYGLKKIAETAMNLRELEPRALSFIAAISKTKMEDYRCYTTRLSSQQHWNF